MFTRRFVVTVFTGIVAVSGTWGSTALAGGQSREFVKDAPATQPGVTGGWTDFEIANQKYYRAYLDRRVLPVAVARVMLPEQQQAQARKILDESAAAWARYQHACRDELKQIGRRTQDLWTKAGQDPTVKAAYSEWHLLMRKLRDVPEERRTAEQKQALQEAAKRTQKTYEATADSRAAMQSRMKYWETEIKGMDIAPTLQKLETVLTAGQMATLNKRLEQMRALWMTAPRLGESGARHTPPMATSRQRSRTWIWRRMWPRKRWRRSKRRRDATASTWTAGVSNLTG